MLNPKAVYRIVRYGKRTLVKGADGVEYIHFKHKKLGRVIMDIHGTVTTVYGRTAARLSGIPNWKI